MNNQLIENNPEEIKGIYKTIEDAGFEVYLVGGCVRDLLTNIQIKDWDMTTNAKPEKIQELFPDSFYDNSFGTVGVPYKTKELSRDDNQFGTVGVPYGSDEDKKFAEITTYRTDHNYVDHRKPESVEWGK